MIDGLVSIVTLLLILVGLVVIHEAGHYLTARLANVRVHEFGIGFPPRALVFHRGRETIWTLNWLPIGGFVRLEGEEGESADPRAFVNARLRTRIGILVAGVAMNALVAWLIFSGIALFADPIVEARIRSVVPGSPAEAAGIVGGAVTGTDANGDPVYDDTGDTIVSIDGERFPWLDHIETIGSSTPQGAWLRAHAGETVTIVLRSADGVERSVGATLRPPDQLDQGALGVTFAALPLGDDLQRTPLEAAEIGARRVIQTSTLILRGVGDLIAHLGDPPVAGPVGMVQSVGAIRTSWPPVFLVWFIGMLSANLAVINLLPFPPMDGGRVALAIARRYAGRVVTPAVERTVTVTGFVILMGLLVWITIFDVRRL